MSARLSDFHRGEAGVTRHIVIWFCIWRTFCRGVKGRGRGGNSKLLRQSTVYIASNPSSITARSLLGRGHDTSCRRGTVSTYWYGTNNACMHSCFPFALPRFRAIGNGLARPPGFFLSFFLFLLFPVRPGANALVALSLLPCSQMDCRLSRDVVVLTPRSTRRSQPLRRFDAHVPVATKPASSFYYAAV